MIKTPRHIAVNVLVSWDKSFHTLDKILEKYSEEISLLSKKDKKLCNALIFGALRHRATIDWTLSKFSKIALNKMDKPLLYILRIALFQILYMDRIPVFAVINTSVDITKQRVGKKPAGFINAVLRNAAKNFINVVFPDPKKDRGKYISIKFSLPLWLSKKWCHEFGFEATCLLGKQINSIPKITLRTNTLKTNRVNLAKNLSSVSKNISLTEYAPQGISFTNPSIPIQEMEAFKQGLFQIQDEAAQIVTHILTPKPNEKILDACAGLGGKTGYIAQIMENQGHITAVDIDSKKLNSLQSETMRLGIDIVQTKPLNLLKTTVKDFDFYFDRVLLDAPCTGLGVLRRNPDSKWKRSRKDITRLCGRQKKMLNASANLVKPGGILVYAVCSCEKEENEEVVYKFLEKRKDFTIDKDCQSNNVLMLPNRLLSKLISDDGFLKTYPDANNMDGFFAARLKRISKS